MTMARRFTNRQRTELFLRTEGSCAICGAILSEFEADHIKPWSRGGQTITANGQPLCKQCNRTKGVHMLLSHQSQFQDHCRLAKASTALSQIFAYVVPGGGKSVLPVIAAHELIPIRGDGLAWITPRSNLRTQAEATFQYKWLRSLLGHSLEIRAATNEHDPMRDKNGYVTTYDAIIAATTYATNPHVQMFTRKRMILVLDEGFHIPVGGDTHKALEPLIERATLVIWMGGCVTRNDNERLALFDYLPPDARGRRLVDLSDNQFRRVCRYTIADATRDHQLIQIKFELRDCEAAWETEDESTGVIENGRIKTFDGASKRDTARGLMTALNTEFAERLLVEAAEYWLQRRRHNSRSKFIVVAALISAAETALRILRGMGISSNDVDIATTKDEKGAEIAIDRFCDRPRIPPRPPLVGLSTVGMCYEGMDCPPADVLCCLTHIRSNEWIEQMLHRVSRFDRDGLPWEQQFATIFAPKDRFFLDILETIRTAQAPYVTEIVPPPPPPPPPDRPQITPLNSNMTSASAFSFDGPPVENAEYMLCNDVLEASHLKGAIPIDAAKRFVEELDRQRAQQQQPQQPPQAQATPPQQPFANVPPSRREKKLRDDIERIKRRGYDKDDPATHHLPHKRGLKIWRMFNKSVEDCTEVELKAILANQNSWLSP
jgi:superfamily II DNA or RNA helicase